ncbi:hypothetical protein M436DRAFT_68451 [Aureobasidium namibiae CBS 147.97]|uniref:Uncharacterized protein n=1 Tax=Aureobasidium namibiae CBS 147.97 TaxID=1043004 RepID=A0A074W4M5_9PEZI
MTPAHDGGLSKPVVLRVIQLFFAFACFAFSILSSVCVRGPSALIIAIFGSAIAMIDASFGWHAITSRTANKRNTILALDYAGLLGLVAATITFICGFAIGNDKAVVVFEAPGTAAGLVSMIVLMWQITWLAPATTKQKDGLVRYTKRQGRMQDGELEQL